MADSTAQKSANNGSGSFIDADNIKTIGGLIAVLVGILAVMVLTIVTVTRLGSDDKESMVAITSSAFGIISAVVGAYLGIKITADTTAKASSEAKNAAVAEHEANAVKHQMSAVEEAVEDKDPELAAEARTAGQEAREEAARIRRPSLDDLAS